MQASRADSPYRIRPTTCPACLRPQNRLFTDRAPPSPASVFIRAKKQEERYTRLLRGVARNVAHLVQGLMPSDIVGADRLRNALDRYAVTLKPWAEAVGERMVAEVAARDERAWFAVAKTMSRNLQREIATAPTGRVVQERQAEQVKLITSLPVEAGQRVHELAREGITKGWRADRIADEIMKTGDVTRSRAELIARTEVSRTATLLTQARAEHVGSEGYIWRTAGDSDVRPSHKDMAGKFVRWDAPPTLDKLTGHAGALPRCRCYPEPVIPDL